MNIHVLKSKIHNAYVTHTDEDQLEGLVVDPLLLDAVDLIDGEQVHAVNYTNGLRLVTCIRSGIMNGGEIIACGPVSKHFSPGDKIILMAYVMIPLDLAPSFRPRIIFPDRTNKIFKP